MCDQTRQSRLAARPTGRPFAAGPIGRRPGRPDAATATRSPRGAFTLIELLVVIAIIALLVSLMVPMLTKAKFLSKATVCGSQLHQICLAFSVYATQNRGSMPRQDLGGTGANLWDVSNDFYNQMRYKYNVPHEALFCPAQDPSLRLSGWNYYGSFTIIGYQLWVPRLNGGRQVPPDPGQSGFSVLDTTLFRGPNDVTDIAMKNPAITDIVSTYGNFPVNGNLYDEPDRLGMDVWAEHRWRNRLEATNQGYADGHVNRIGGKAPFARYLGNWWNWR